MSEIKKFQPKPKQTGLSPLGELGIEAAGILGGAAISGISDMRQNQKNTELQQSFNEDIERENMKNEKVRKRSINENKKFQAQFDEISANRQRRAMSHQSFLDEFEQSLEKIEAARSSAHNLANQATANQGYRDILRQTGSL